MSEIIMPVISSINLRIDSVDIAEDEIIAIATDNLSRTIRAAFYDSNMRYGIDTDAVVQLFVARPDSEVLYKTATKKNMEEDGSEAYDSVEVELNGDMIKEPGIAMAQFVIWDRDLEQSIRSQRFRVVIGEKIDNLDAQESEADYGMLAQMINRAVEEYLSDNKISSGQRNYTTHQADDLYISQFMGILKSYHDNRKKEDGSNVFVYGHGTAVDGVSGNQIDCSAYVELALMGVPFADSPYASLGAKEDTSADDTGEDEGEGNETDSDSDGGTIEINVGKYDWAVDLRQYQRLKENEVEPVRTASQLAEWMSDSGWMIEYAPDFSNLRRGDIVFYAKKNGDDTWKKPDRFMHISHVAVVSSIYKNDGTLGIDNKYPLKHTLYEVSTYGGVVLNTTLEKRYPDRIVMVCRPQFGVKSDRHGVGSVYMACGSYDVNNLFEEGTYYLTSKNTMNLPGTDTIGTGYTIRVDRSINNWGGTYSIVQTLYNTKGAGVFVRKQYCYPRYTPAADKWTEWESITGSSSSDGITKEDLSSLIEEYFRENPVSGVPSGFIADVQNLFRGVAYWNSDIVPNPSQAIANLSKYASGEGGDEPVTPPDVPTNPTEPVSIGYEGTTAVISGLASTNINYNGTTAEIGG